MGETKAIKISEENYKAIYEYAGEIQKEIGQNVSIDKALTILLKKQRKLSDFKGRWKMTEEEVKQTKKEIKRGWSKWKI